MVNSYPACTKSDNSALFISCSSCYYTARWTVPTFLSTSLMLQSTGLHHTVDRTMYHCIKLFIYLQNKLCRLFCSKMCIYCCYGNWSITRVTGVRGGGGLCPDRNGKTVTSRKKFTIWHICTIKCTVGP